MNISSLVVNADPGRIDAVRAGLGVLPGVELQGASEDGKLVVTIEADSDEATLNAFGRIGEIDGVMSTAMVYHQFESDPEREA